MTTERDPTIASSTLTSTLPNEDEDEDPSLSSASLCIQFRMMGATFRPVFTHQAFPGETIRGYHPPLKTLMECSSIAKAKAAKTNNTGDTPTCSALRLHSSHMHHEAATKEVYIEVSLAPSCQSCQVNIATEKKRLPRRQSGREAKRPRLDGGAAATTNPTIITEENKECSAPIVEADSSMEQQEEQDNANSNDDDDSFQDNASNNSSSEPEYNEKDNGDDDSEFEVDDEGVSEVEDEADNKEGATRTSRMPTKEILQSMKKGLPEVVNKMSSIDETFLRRPLGVELQEYSVKGKDFVLSLATGVESSSFHEEVQRLSLWFIETGDDVDVASQEGGFWNVLYLFQKHKRTQYSLAGYITLFHFHAPFKKPKPGYVVRICQALVLPPYQRMGHGKHLLTCVMDIAHSRYASLLPKKKKEDEDAIVEINVESPAPAFVMLRNRTDFDCFLQSIETKDPWIESLVDGDSPPKITDPDFFVSISETDITQVAARAKITPRQIQVVQELYKLHQLQRYLESSKVDGEEREALEKRFRLMLKKRLNKDHREDLSGLRTKAEKQSFLEEEYSKCLESYRVTLPRAKLT